MQHACGASKTSEKSSPGFSEHVISEKSWISVLFSLCTLCSMPAALRRPQKNAVLDFQSMSCLTDPPNSSSRPSQSSPRPSQSLFWAGPGPGGDLGGSRGSPNSPFAVKICGFGRFGTHPRNPRNHRIRCQELRLGTSLPRAPGSR